MNVPTPGTVIQLYRLVLQHAGAAVLYSKPAMQNLRALYRPEFDIWMRRAKQGEQLVQGDRAEWEEFARRVQNTLNLLHRSSTANDLPHKLTANLASMQYHMDPKDSIAARRSGTQSMTLQQSRADFLPGKKSRNQGEIDKLHAWDGFAELVGMAEGSAGLLLGKVRPRKALEDR